MPPDRSVLRSRPQPRCRLAFLALGLGVGVGAAGCAAPRAVPHEITPPPAAVTAAAPAPAAAETPASKPVPATPSESPAATPPAPSVALAPAPVPAPRPTPVESLLAHADLLRSLPPSELAQEAAQVADAADPPPRLLRLVLALNLARTPVNNIRAQVLLQRVLAQNSAEARTLHPLARLLAAHVAEMRRFDEQVERQNQQLRDAQRRIEQLNDRLEAVRAIERSLPSRPLPDTLPGAAGRP